MSRKIGSTPGFFDSTIREKGKAVAHSRPGFIGGSTTWLYDKKKR